MQTGAEKSSGKLPIDRDVEAIVAIDAKLDDVSMSKSIELAQNQSLSGVSIALADRAGTIGTRAKAADTIDAADTRQNKAAHNAKMEMAADACQVLLDRALNIKKFLDAIPDGPRKQPYKKLESAVLDAIQAVTASIESRPTGSLRRFETDEARFTELNKIFQKYAPPLIAAYNKLSSSELSN